MSHRVRGGGALVAVCLATAGSLVPGTGPSLDASGCGPVGGVATSSPPAAAGVRYPARVSGSKVLDQNGRVYLMRTFSSWAMAQQLSNAEITTALQGVASNGFNAVTVWVGGGYDLGSGWNRYTNDKGDRFWAGTPWASGLGAGWSSVDWIVRETARLGLAANLSFGGGWDTTGAGEDWELVTDADMYRAGVAIANRYRAYPHIVWHIMFDEPSTPSSTRGRRMDALFHGINDTEGKSTRPVRWAEPNNGASTYDQLINSSSRFSHVNLTLNGWYDYDDDSTVIAEAGCAEASMPVGDVEPPYDGAGHYGGDQGQQLRERSYATFLEGGAYINYGQEDWWPFGAQGLFSESLDWAEVPSHSHTLQQRHVWSLIDQYVADATWVPTSQFVTTGEGSGDTKAAVGASNTAAIAYFPTARSVIVDTSVIAGSSPVRLRWYDPTTGSYTTIAASETQNASRAVTIPNAHPDGTRDWVLVVDTPQSSGDVLEAGGVALGGHFDLSGNADVFVYRAGSALDDLYWGSGAGEFAKTTVAVQGTYRPFTGDFDGDGLTDIFWYAPGAATDRVWFATGDRTFRSHAVTNVQGTYRPVAGDFDGDGRADILWHAPGAAADSLWFATSSRSFTKAAVKNVSGSYTPISADFDNDDRADIFWYAPGVAADALWFGNANRTFTNAAVPNVQGSYRPAAGRLDNHDSNDDILWYAPGTAADWVWFSNGDGTFTSKPAPAMSPSNLQPLVGSFSSPPQPAMWLYNPGGGQRDPMWTGTASQTFVPASPYRNDHP